MRRGDPVTSAVALAREVGAEGIAVAADVSRYARIARSRPDRACEGSRLCATRFSLGSTVCRPARCGPAAAGPRTRSSRRTGAVWRGHGWRPAAPTPRRMRYPRGSTAGTCPRRRRRGLSTDASPAARQGAPARLKRWLGDLADYDDNHDLMAVDRTSRLSPYLRFGCLSPLEVARPAWNRRAGGRGRSSGSCAGATSTTRWRPRFPARPRNPYGRSAEDWRDDPEQLQAWREGRTGVPIVDAGMRQLRREGWMHNRARLLVGVVPHQAPASWTGGRAATGSSPCCWTATCPTTTATGSGWPAPATTPSRTGGSIRSGRPTGSTRWRLRPAIRAGTVRRRGRGGARAVEAAPAARGDTHAADRDREQSRGCPNRPFQEWVLVSETTTQTARTPAALCRGRSTMATLTDRTGTITTPTKTGTSTTRPTVVEPVPGEPAARGVATPVGRGPGRACWLRCR